MRRSPVILALLASFATPTLALEASDTMAAWRGASAKDKGEVVTRILRETGDRRQPAAIVKCLDKASGVPGHEDLAIAEVAKACADDGSEPA